MTLPCLLPTFVIAAACISIFKFFNTNSQFSSKPQVMCHDRTSCPLWQAVSVWHNENTHNLVTWRKVLTNGHTSITHIHSVEGNVACKSSKSMKNRVRLTKLFPVAALFAIICTAQYFSFNKSYSVKKEYHIRIKVWNTLYQIGFAKGKFFCTKLCL